MFHSDGFQNFTDTSNYLWRFPVRYFRQPFFKIYLENGGEEQGEEKGIKTQHTVTNFGYQNASVIHSVQEKWNHGENTERGVEIPGLKFQF